MGEAINSPGLGPTNNKWCISKEAINKEIINNQNPTNSKEDLTHCRVEPINRAVSPYSYRHTYLQPVVLFQPLYYNGLLRDPDHGSPAGELTHCLPQHTSRLSLRWVTISSSPHSRTDRANRLSSYDSLEDHNRRKSCSRGQASGGQQTGAERRDR